MVKLGFRNKTKVGNLAKLTFVALPYNNLSGLLPFSLFNLPNLSRLYLQNNQLVGPLPNHVSGLLNLNRLYLSSNFLNGTLPSWLFSLPSLEILSIREWRQHRINLLHGPQRHKAPLFAKLFSIVAVEVIVRFKIKTSTANTKRDIAPLDVNGNRGPDLFATVIWSLWNRHNNLRLGKPALPLDKALDFARDHLTEHPSSTLSSSNPQQRLVTTWTTPEAHGFKVNFDGATKKIPTREWRMLSASASLRPICGILHREPPAFTNGALHWIAFRNDNKQFVLVFDLGDEVFRQILLPQLPSYTGRMVWTCVSVYGNSIAGFPLDYS
nr:phytosulfokine receptor 1 [Quercus suber]